MPNLFGMPREEIEAYFLSKGDKKYRAIQVYEWLYQKRVFDIDLFSNIKNEVREELKKDFDTSFIKIHQRQKDELTVKYLFHLEDQEAIEAVVMMHDYGVSICVSSQVGCNMGCRFCESGRLKKRRNLKAYEMVQQILLAEADLGMRISSVVIMGIGVPLDNFLVVTKFIKIINDA